MAHGTKRTAPAGWRIGSPVFDFRETDALHAMPKCDPSDDESIIPAPLNEKGHPIAPREKVCRLCGKTKPLSDFGRDRTYADGFHTACRQCCRELQSKRPSYDVSVSEKTCRTCGKTKPASEFWRRTALKDGLMSECEQCRRKRQVGFYAKWLKSDREKHPEKVRARWLLNYAVSKGSIVKPTHCESCSKELPLHAHHSDYDRPLEVAWLCHSCHMKLHMRLNRGVA